MCTILSALSAGASLYTGIAQAKNVKAQADAQAQALETNAKNQEILAHDAVEQGGQEELKLRRNLAKLFGNQRTQSASSGVDIDSGSALDARNASISEGEQDAETIRFNAARQRWGYLNQADNLNNQAKYYRAQGKYNSNNILFGNIIGWGLGVGEEIYNRTNKTSSPLTDYDDRTKYWADPYRAIRRSRGGSA